MIFRKPYAILIKIFRPLHFILTIIFVYISLKFYNVYNFLSTYVKAGSYSYIRDLPNAFVNSWMYLSLIIALIILALILLLLTVKKKPVVLYWILFIISMISFFFVFKIHSTLSLLELSNIEIRNLIITRDISVVLSVIGILLALCTFARSLGFDIKKFEFQKDIKQLRVEAMDNEEFEIDVDIDKNDVKTRIKRFLRKLKYYIVENKKIILIIVVMGLIIISSSIYINKEVINKIYSENQSIVVDNIEYKIINTYIVSKDYKGNDISDNMYAYAIVQLEISNNSESLITFNIDNTVLKIKESSYNTILTSYDSFNDLGIGYVKQSIKPLNNGTYIIVYKIDKDNKTSKMYLKLATNSGKKTIKLQPIIFNAITTNDTIILNDTMNLSSSIFKGSTFKISDYKIEDTFKYTIGEQNITILPKNLKTKNTVMRLDSVFELSSDLKINKITNNDFINNFMSIQYILEGKNYQISVADITPKEHSENYTYLEVPMDIKKATEINLIFVVRNQKYVYQIKS